jgi:hypothetical protein
MWKEDKRAVPGKGGSFRLDAVRSDVEMGEGDGFSGRKERGVPALDRTHCDVAWPKPC